MKKFISPAYTFTPGISGVGSVALTGIADFNIKSLISIINQTDGIVVYSTASPLLKYTSVAGSTVTLFFDTSSMSAGDTLQVIYEQDEALVPESYDEVVTTYVGATTRINTVVYKLATVTVGTLTFSYDGSDRLSSVVRS